MEDSFLYRLGSLILLSTNIHSNEFLAKRILLPMIRDQIMIEVWMLVDGSLLLLQNEGASQHSKLK